MQPIRVASMLTKPQPLMPLRCKDGALKAIRGKMSSPSWCIAAMRCVELGKTKLKMPSSM